MDYGSCGAAQQVQMQVPSRHHANAATTTRLNLADNAESSCEKPKQQDSMPWSVVILKICWYTAAADLLIILVQADGLSLTVLGAGLLLLLLLLGGPHLLEGI